MTDHLAESEPHAISIARNILGNLNMAAAGTSTSPSPSQLGDAMAHSQQLLQRASSLPTPAWEEPLFPAEQLRGELSHAPAAACCVTFPLLPFYAQCELADQHVL